MTALDLQAHLVGVLHGVGACVACYALFYLCGLGLMPRSWAGDDRGEGFPALLGAAVFVLWCWYGIKLGVPLGRLILPFIGATAVLIGLRGRWMRSALAGQRSGWRSGTAWMAVFVGLYLVGYLFLTPSVSPALLPPAWLGNPDLLNYATTTRYVLTLGPSNVAGHSFMTLTYPFTPAVFSVLGLLSMFYGRDPILSAMPALFGATALTGLLAARISRSVFRLSRKGAAAVAAIFVSGSFFRYVAGNYFLSTFFAIPVVLYLVWTTATCPSERPFADLRHMAKLFALYVLMFFAYPPMVVFGVAAQFAAIVVNAISSALAEPRESGAWKTQVRRGSSAALQVLPPLAAVALCDPWHMRWMVRWMGHLSQPGVAGWPLDMISPLTLLGGPSDIGRIQVGSAAARGYGTLALCLLAVAMAACYFTWLRRRTTTAERTLVGLSAGSLVAYCAAFAVLGPSYQQWKLASYAPLPFSFVVFAAGARAWSLVAAGGFAARLTWARRSGAVMLAVVPVALVSGNLYVHATSDPPLYRMRASLRNMERLDAFKTFREMYVEMSGPPFNTFLAVYYIRNKELHLVSPSYYPVERLTPDRITRGRPLFIEADYPCESVAESGAITIPGVGCLLQSPPSPRLDVSYPFTSIYPFIETAGLSSPEPFGRWSASPSVQVGISVDGERFPTDERMYVNLRMSPFVARSIRRQRIGLSWGASRRADEALAAREWISLPAGPADWTGDRFKTLTISLSFPDAAVPMSIDDRSRDARLLAVTFEEMSLTRQPQGRTVPRSLALDTAYAFSRDVAAVEATGMHPPEAWGRWSRDPVVGITLAGDPDQLPTSQPLFANLLVRTYLAPGARDRVATFSWGAGRRAATRLAGRERISLPLRSADWSGGTGVTLTISIDLPGAVAPHSVDPRSPDLRPLAVGFEELSISTRPLGRALTLATGPSR
jgi:hypothetical protein